MIVLPSAPLRLSSVSFAYVGDNGHRTAVLDNVAFEMRPNEFLCVMGPNGCGKTTLLNIIAGFLTAETGEVRVHDRLIDAPGPDRTVVFQDYALFPWKRVRDNIAFGLKASGKDRKSQLEIAEKFLALVHLNGTADKYPHELSGGMRQRVAVARALAVDPSILLMDEPLGALDAQTRELLQEELSSVLEFQHKSVFFVTHSVDEAVFLGDRIILLSPAPATVAAIIPIDLPRPRNAEVRLTPQFIAVKSKVARLLRDMYAGT